MVSGLLLDFKFGTCVTGRSKWPVAPASAIAISMAILICDVLNIVSVLFKEFIDRFAVDALRCVPTLEQLLMTTVFLSSSSDKKGE